MPDGWQIREGKCMFKPLLRGSLVMMHVQEDGSRIIQR